MTDCASPTSDGISEDLKEWLGVRAQGLDDGSVSASDLLPALGRAGLIGIGSGMLRRDGDITDAVAAIASVSERSLTAGFVLWSQRTYLEYLLQSPNAALRNRLWPEIVSGQLAGATGLSNAMKFLAGLEELQITAHADRDDFVIDGRMPWVTNLRPEGFHVAGVAAADGRVLCVSLAHDDPGLTRSADLDLMALRASNTAAVSLANVRIDPERIIHPDAAAWLPQVRPAFLGLQCGMSIGLARRALAEARAAIGSGRSILSDPIDEASNHLFVQANALAAGLKSGTFQANAASLFRIRIALADIAAEAVSLELQAFGGRAYLRPNGSDFARRHREAAFVPIITPSLVQLKVALGLRERDAA